jgi:hypothetical protein
MNRIAWFVPALFLAFPAAVPDFVPPAEANPLFSGDVVRVGSNPYGLGSADFNGDGIADLVAANFGDFGRPGDLSVAFGLGDGSFTAETRVATAYQPTGVVAADFDADGIGDLVITYSQLNMAVFKRGLGDGTFGPEELVAGNFVYRLQLADINHDGLPDLLNDLAIGTGGFQAILAQPGGHFFIAPGNVQDITFNPAAGDFNGDGYDDVATIHYVPGADPHEIYIFLGNGDGSFTFSGSQDLGGSISWLMPADVDGDGYEDLGVSLYELHDSGLNSDFQLFFSNNGDGTFIPGTRETEAYGIALAAYDRNGDGLQDFVRIGDYDVTPYLAGAPRSFLAMPWFATGSGVTGSVVSDFEGDGRKDLALLSNDAETIFLHPGNAEAGFGPHLDGTVRETYIGGLVAHDFDGDGVLDMANAVLPEDQVGVRLGHGDGTFGPETRYSVGVGPLFLAGADMNGDGNEDLVVSLRNWHFEYPDPLVTGDVVVLLGNGDGTFQPATAPVPSGLTPDALHVADFDGDGIPDVVVANGTDLSGVVKPDVSFFHGVGDGTLLPMGTLDVGSENHFPYGWTYPMALASGDLDADGHDDLVVGLTGLYDVAVPGTVRVLRALAGGGFAAPVTVGLTESTSGLGVADLDADGDLDIAVTDVASYTAQRPGALFRLLNDGTGAFAQSAPLDAGIAPFGVQPADLTGDGVLELVVLSGHGYLAIFSGLGGAAYDAPFFVAPHGPAMEIAIGDFDGDGPPDILMLVPSGAFVMHNKTPVEVALQIDAVLSFSSPAGRGSGTLTFTTNVETDLVGFNVVEIDPTGTHAINRALIPCEECTTGLGTTYAFIIPKHRGGRNLYVEAVHQDLSTTLFGPARRDLPD